MEKRPNDNFKRFMCILALVSVLVRMISHTNPSVSNLKLVLVLTNVLGRNLISVLDLTNLLGRNLISVVGLTNPLSHRLISALVLTSHIKYQAILLILLCLATPFCNSARLFLFSISLLFVINHPLLKY